MNKDIKRIVRELTTKGWTHEGQNRHIKMRSPSGHLVTIAVSPSCPHALKNIEKEIQRIEKKSSEKALS